MTEASDSVFSKIATRYDLINRILSLGQERKWRATGVRQLNEGVVLDLGCGTGDTDFEGRTTVGIDPVVEMLSLSPVSARVAGVGESLPFRESTFDGVFTAFVMRNLASIPHTLEEVNRVLKPDATAVMIDLARPVNPVLRFFHRIGTAIVLPLVGFLFAGAAAEYWYLNKTLDSLPQPEELFADHRLTVEEIWRMGAFGFVYGVRLRKVADADAVDPAA